MSRNGRASQMLSSKTVTYWRQPTDPQRGTPANIREALLAMGGKNEYHEPLWRVILAGQHLVQRAGEWRTAGDRDHVEFADRGDGALNYVNREIKPEKVEFGVKWIPLYPVDGWILERWFPASCFGDPFAWEAVKSQDGVTPMMGPYPTRGDYWMMKGPWREIPSLSQLRQGIASWENSTAHAHGNVDKVLFERTFANTMKMLEAAEAAQYERVLKQATDLRVATMKDLFSNPRLTAHRNRILNERGWTSHF